MLTAIFDGVLRDRIVTDFHGKQTQYNIPRLEMQVFHK